MKLFRRQKEDFVCEHCNFKVVGNGYTNHCPKCLYSKHVDINPGDRAEICRGLMNPLNADLIAGEYIIIHKCLNCRVTRKNKTAKEDDFDIIISLIG
ncbi:MAG: RNHCP domain-containing protein [Candidatus Doudnabacteria bacterium]